MEYKITISNQVKVLTFLIIGSMFLGGMVYALYRNEGFSTELVQFFLVYYIILLFPTLYLHFEYYLKNRNRSLIINTAEKHIIVDRHAKVSFGEILCIVYVMPPVWHRKGFIRLLPFEDYHYARIELKNGETFIFTCLMGHRVEDVLMQIEDVPVIKKKRLIASVLIR